MKKKAIFYILAIVTILLLSGCGDSVSRKEYEELASRLEAVEKRLGMASQTPSSEVTSTSTTISKETEEKEEADFVYIIKDMSAQEIYDEIMYYLNNKPREGQTYDEYRATLKCEPTNSPDSSLGYSFMSDKVRDEFSGEDHISRLQVGGTYTSMDGTIGISDSNNKFTFYMTLFITDYDKAVELYDKIATFVTGLEGEVGYRELQDSRVTTTWQVGGWYWPTESSGSYEEPLIMNRRENGFSFNIKIVY